jgi:hypothetical protein
MEAGIRGGVGRVAAVLFVFGNHRSWVRVGFRTDLGTRPLSLTMLYAHYPRMPARCTARYGTD